MRFTTYDKGNSEQHKITLERIMKTWNNLIALSQNLPICIFDDIFQLYVLEKLCRGWSFILSIFQPQNYVAEADAMIQLPYLHVEKQIQFWSHLLPSYTLHTLPNVLFIFDFQKTDTYLLVQALLHLRCFLRLWKTV